MILKFNCPNSAIYICWKRQNTFTVTYSNGNINQIQNKTNNKNFKKTVDILQEIKLKLTLKAWP